MLIKVITLATLLCVVCAQSCTYDWECGNVPYTVCQEEPAGCSTTLKGIAIDEYPNVYYATICPATSGGLEVSFKSVPLTGGVPTVLHSVPASSGQSSLSVLDGLFNSIYFQPYANGPLQRVIAGQVFSQGLRRNFGGQLNLEFEPEGQSFACSTSSSPPSPSPSPSARSSRAITDASGSDASGGSDESTPTPTPSPSPTPNPEPSGPYDSIDLYDGLRELYFGFTKAIYILPVDSCGPSRLGPQADGSSSTDLYFSTVIAGATNFYFGTTTCTNCALPPVLFSVNEVVNDFDVSTQYIFFGTNSGLYRTDLNGGNQVQLTTDNVSGVRVGEDKVYFNAGSSIRSINFDGTANTRLDQVAAGQSTCQCREGFSGSNCAECDGQVQWNNGIPSCVAV